MAASICSGSPLEWWEGFELGWPPVRVRNDVASFLDRTDQLDLVTLLLHNPAQLGCGKSSLSTPQCND